MRYAILNTSDIDTVDFSKVKQTDANSVRFFKRCNALYKPRNNRNSLEYR